MKKCKGMIKGTEEQKTTSPELNGLPNPAVHPPPLPPPPAATPPLAKPPTLRTKVIGKQKLPTQTRAEKREAAADALAAA